MKRRSLTVAEASDLIDRPESHFFDHKSCRARGPTIQSIACQFANAEGGDFVVGVEDKSKGSGVNDRWRGFENEEAGDYIFQSITHEVSPPVLYMAEWLQINGRSDLGLVCKVTIQKSQDVHQMANGKVFVRRNASKMELTGSAIADLSLSKGSRSYEDKLVENYEFDRLATEPELEKFLGSYSPTTDALDFTMNQELVDNNGKVRVSGALLFAENPSAVVPRRCGIKISRYETTEPVGTRDHLKGVPVSVEGPLNSAVRDALEAITEMLSGQMVKDVTGELVPTRYPADGLHEVVVNAAIHRDFNISDDVQIRVFDNRVEVESPGRLPGHITIDNMTSTRFGRNPTVVRLLNKYPDPLNKDIGDGIPTLIKRMKQAGLMEPQLEVRENSFLVVLRHRPLARPEELVLSYLDQHDSVTNSVARDLTEIRDANKVKQVFYNLRSLGFLEQIPELKGSQSAWRPTAAGKTEAAKVANRMNDQE